MLKRKKSDSEDELVNSIFYPCEDELNQVKRYPAEKNVSSHKMNKNTFVDDCECDFHQRVATNKFAKFWFLKIRSNQESGESAGCIPNDEKSQRSPITLPSMMSSENRLCSPATIKEI